MAKRKVHGNSLKNKQPHHLYEIRDKELGDVFKYGISHDPIEEDGLSKRIRVQLELMNLAVNWIRFFAQILLTNIPGRKRAKEIEDDYINEYAKKNGKKPRGNK